MNYVKFICFYSLSGSITNRARHHRAPYGGALKGLLEMSAKEKKSKLSKGQITSIKIKAVARELFLEYGYSKTSLRHIAQAAGISPSSIYLYFSNKEELFNSLGLPDIKDEEPTSIKTKTEIARTAMVLFAEKGFDRTSIDDIAEAVSLSKPVLYRYFKNKEDLFLSAIQTTRFAYASETLFRLPKDTDIRKAVHQIGREYLHLFNDSFRCALLKTIIAESQRFPQIGQYYLRNGDMASSENIKEFFRMRYHCSDEILDSIQTAFIVFIASLRSYIIMTRIIVSDVPPLNLEKYLQIASDHFSSYLISLGFSTT